jgi:hypothetical protein
MKQNISLFLSAASLTFQVTVLYPWHIELSDQMKKLSDQVSGVCNYPYL